VAKIITYLEETVDELLNKVSWPTWKELQTSAIIVLVASVIIALLVWIMDFTFGIRDGEGVIWQGILGFYYDFVTPEFLNP
jgi:preprotein translocase subunit SecE|tara:strand:- start:193 stop:435 length:243 start_codon:yes stop_codon:yes gene_type:complete